MSLLDKFAAVKMDPTKTILQGEDLEICTKYTNDFLSAFSFYDLQIEFLDINREANQYIPFEDMLEEIEKKVEEIAKEYIGDIVFHFTGKYKISIDVENCKNKLVRDLEYHVRQREKEKKTLRERLKRFKISLVDIVALIQDQLGGMTLSEKGEEEIKEKFCDNFAIMYHRGPSVELAKNRISFNRAFGFTPSYNGRYRFGYHDSSMLYVFLRGISLFETGQIEVSNVFSSLMRSDDHWSGDQLFREHEIPSKKVNSIRFYKNGKTVIKFDSDENAAEFFRVFCKEGKQKR